MDARISSKGFLLFEHDKIRVSDELKPRLSYSGNGDQSSNLESYVTETR